MSTATQKRNLADALADAQDFMRLLGHCTTVWHIAGSIRRGKPLIGDAEHVCIPKFEDVPGSGMFGEPVRTNLLWRELDQFVRGDESSDESSDEHWSISKAIYTDKNGRDSFRWGERMRSVVFRGMKHEIYTADDANFGCQLSIRTGPHEFSEMLVTRLHQTALRQDKGYLRYRNGDVYPCPTEELFFKMCGIEWIEPAKRDHFRDPAQMVEPGKRGE